MRRRFFSIKTGIPNNQIKYISTTRQIINFPSDFINAPIVSNVYDMAKNEGTIICDGDIEILYFTAWEKSKLSHIVLPESVTSIGEEAFYNCTSLTSITIPDSVTSIGSSAFSDCSSLKEFKGKFAADGGRCLIMDNTIIAYANASGTTYVIPNSVTSIGKDAFYDCDSLASVTIPDSVTSIGKDAFYDCDSLASVTIPDSVTTIGKDAFSGCKSLTSVTIPDSVTTIENGAFSNCKSLTSVTISDSVTTIGEWAFYNCTSLTSVTIPDSVTTIENGAFSDCTSLKSVTIPDSVTSIGSSAFSDCTSLKSVYCKATTPPTLGGTSVFENNTIDRKIYVPYQSLDAYKTAEYWSEYAANIVGYDFDKGKVIINFSIDGGTYAPGYTSTYQAEEGMTWGEWVDSGYNTKGFISSGNRVKTSSGVYEISGSSIGNTIIAERTYFIGNGSGGI